MKQLSDLIEGDEFIALNEGHVVFAVVRSCGLRVSRRVNDGKLFIWYRDIPVF